MPLPAILLIVATLLPLISFGVLAFIGKRMGQPIAGWFGTLMVVGSFACSLAAMMTWVATGGADTASPWGYGLQPIHLPIKWVPVGTLANNILTDHPGWLDVGIYIDSFTIVMFLTITGIAALVHLFSVGYLRGDKRFARFFTYLGLSCFSMLGLVIGSSLLQIFIFWELVAASSYLLIGFWDERRAASNAAVKAFVMNRLGDCGLLIGFGILLYHVGNPSLPMLWKLLGDAGNGTNVTLPNGAIFSATLLTITGIALFFGAVGKSAQFPLHTWLADATAGPSPANALVYAATTVAAGVYLIARIFPILSPDAKLFIAIIGCITLIVGALIACVQSDIKKVLAFSTLSQLGYMMLAMGIGSWVGGLFHLIANALISALLFLAAGSVVHATKHEQELPQFGGLFRRLPVSAITFFIAVLAIAGFGVGGWGFAGYSSKALIFQNAAAFGFETDHASGTRGFNAYWLLFWLPVAVAYLTPFYLMRCWTLTFWGKPRNQELHDEARESPILWTPLIILAIGSIIGGNLLLVREFIENARTEITHLVKTDVFANAWQSTDGKLRAGDAEAVAENSPSKLVIQEVHSAQAPRADELLNAGQRRTHAALAGGFAWLIGLALGFLMYMNGYRVADTLLQIPPLRWIHTWLYRRMDFDELYSAVFVGTVRGFSSFASAFDRHVIDGAVNSFASMVRGISSLAGFTDKYIIDGAAKGVGVLADDIGSAASPARGGRIRIVVSVLIAVVAIGGLIVAISVLSRM